MTKAELLNTLKTARAEWDELVEKALKREADGTHRPYAEGEYSLKDVIAHVTWYERETVGIIKARALRGSPHWRLPTVDERNAAVYRDIHELPLETVLTQAKEVYGQLVEAVEGLSNKDIEDATAFQDMPWTPARLVSGNAYDHYYQHIPLIRAWLGGP